MNQEFSFKTSRGDILNTMMSKADTAKLIKEAMSSPLGSTSRTRAKKLFSIMSKLHNSYDGSGGMGEADPYAMGEVQNYSSPEPESPKSMVVFRRIPKPNISFNNNQEFDGVGGIGDFFTGVKNFFTGSPQIEPSQNQPINVSSDYLKGLSSGNTPGLNVANPNSPTGLTFNNSPGKNAPQTPISITPVQTLSNDVARQIVNGNAPGISTAAPSVSKNQDINAMMQGSSGLSFDGPKPVSVSDFIKNRPQQQQPSQQQPIPVNTQQKPAVQRTISQQAPAGLPANQGGVNIPQSSNIAYTNNNPGNLMFVGQAGATQGSPKSGGGSWAKFESPEAGYEALKNQITLDANRGLTVSQFIGKYAPASENNTGQYIQQAASSLGISPDASLSTVDLNQMASFIARKESGTVIGGQSSMGPSGVTPSYGDVNAAVANLTGPGMFGLAGAQKAMGGTLQELTDANQKSLWSKYNVGGLQTEEERLRNEGALLPGNVIAYIKARDTSLAQTDKEIDAYINDAMTKMDTSDPVKAQQASAHLNYLYTLRGRQNQTYIGFLNDAVTQHQAQLDHVSNLYQTALKTYSSELSRADNITSAQFDMYSKALADMYTTVQDAPLKALQTEALKMQMDQANADQVAAAAKMNDQEGFIAQGNKLEGYVWDAEHMVKPGTDLVKVINEFSALDPSISPANIIQAYSMGVNNYLNAPNDKDGTGKGINDLNKRRLAEEAIQQFANFAMQGSDNPNAVVLGQTLASEVAQSLGSKVGNSISVGGKAPQLMEAVTTLAPSGWFGNKKPPTVEEFSKTVTSKTGDPLDESLAKAIYSVFQRYVSDDGDTTDSPKAAVNALLYSTNSTQDRAVPTLLSTDDFAKQIGSIYASSIMSNAFGQ